jgi:hypothetical protein
MGRGWGQSPSLAVVRWVGGYCTISQEVSLKTKIGKRAALLRVIPAWETTILVQRLEDCRVLLSIHGYLRESESQRIKWKLQDDFDRGM